MRPKEENERKSFMGQSRREAGEMTGRQAGKKVERGRGGRGGRGRREEAERSTSQGKRRSRQKVRRNNTYCRDDVNSLSV
jgi:hypothetical protein